MSMMQSDNNNNNNNNSNSNCDGDEGSSSSSNKNDGNQLRGSDEKIDQDEDESEEDGEQNGIDRVWSVSETVIVPTEVYDGGGGMNYTRPNQAEQQQQPRRQQVNGGEGSADETMEMATATASRPDSFQIYSDRNTRMATLLGLQPASNPHDGDERENWRQLTGFQGLGGRRRRPHENEDDDDNARVEVEGQPEPNVDASTRTTTSRQTRLSWELHLSAFGNMWTQNGVFDPPDEDSNMSERPRQPNQHQRGELDPPPDYPYDIVRHLQQFQRQPQHGEVEESNDDDDDDANGQAG